jgi:uncharacterized protein (DUF736 family)
MKLGAFRNPMKSTQNSPDYIVMRGNQRIGIMYRNKDRSGLTYFNIILDEDKLRENAVKTLVVKD